MTIKTSSRGMQATEGVRRIVYESRSTASDDEAALGSILESSRRNNGIDGVSGILWAEDGRYLQLLEGPSDSVTEAFARIARDERHADVTVLEDRDGVEREFGDWAMAGLGPGDGPDDARRRLAMLLAGVDEAVRSRFDLGSRDA